MKKLIPMMLVSAAAAGAYAGTLVESAISFQAGEEAGCEEGVFNPATQTSDNDLLWAGAADATLKLAEYGAEAKYAYAEGRYVELDEDQLNYLSIETAKGEPLIRTFANVAGGIDTVDVSAPIYVDTLVKFTAFEEAPEIAEDAKIAVWTEASETEGMVNLVVACGYVGDPSNVAKVEFSDYAADVWHRLTIRTTKEAAVEDTQLGFRVFVDGIEILPPEETLLGDTYVPFFPAMAEGMELAGVGFEGIGAIDDLAIDATGPAFAQDKEEVGVAFTLPTLDNATITADPASPVAAGTEVTFTVTPAAGYLFADGSAAARTFSLEIKEEGEIEIPDGVNVATAAALAKVGDGALYLTLADAYTAADAGATITLLGNCEGNGISIAKAITIDFAGKTYTVNFNPAGSTGTKSQAFQVLKEAGTVTFKNGTITSTDVVKMLVNNYCDLTLNGMTLDGTNMGVAHKAGTEIVVPNYTLSNNNGTTTLTGGTEIISKGAGHFAMDTYDSKGYEGIPTVVVNGATITGDVELSGGNLTLTAGTLTGALVATAIGEGAITKAAGFTAAAPEGYEWDDAGKLVEKTGPTDWEDITEDTPVADIPGMPEEVKGDGIAITPAQIKTWAEKNNVEFGTAGITAEALLLNCAPDEVEEAAKEFVLDEADVAAILAGDTKALKEKYPMAEVKFEPVKVEGSTANLFRGVLVFPTLKP